MERKPSIKTGSIPRIAAIVTAFFPVSHADVILSRWRVPHPGDEHYGWYGASTTIVSLWVAQYPENDIGRRYAAENGVCLCESVEESLTLGTGALAVDGVLLIGEHGDYPVNERGQKLYPRKELFDEIVQVFRGSGRSVPVFCDKHLSWNPAWALEMVNTARFLGFPLMAGSSAPHCRLIPDPPLGKGEAITEAMGVAFGGPETYGFHSLELVQSIIENRHGGEAGVCSVTAWRGEAVWEALEPEHEELALAAMKTAPSLKEGDFRINTQGAIHPPVLYRFEHCDGICSHHLLLSGHLSDFTVSVRLKSGEVRAACAEMGGREGFYPNFARLNAAIDSMFLTRSNSGEERALLTTLLIAACAEALQQPGKRLSLP